MSDDADPAPLVRRNEKGHLLPGSKLAQGHKNPAVAMRLELQREFLRAVGADRLRQVIEHHLDLIGRATPREAAALLELLYSYCLGKPVASVQMDVSHDADRLPTATLRPEHLAALEQIRRDIATDTPPPGGT